LVLAGSQVQLGLLDPAVAQQLQALAAFNQMRALLPALTAGSATSLDSSELEAMVCELFV